MPHSEAPRPAADLLANEARASDRPGQGIRCDATKQQETTQAEFATGQNFTLQRLPLDRGHVRWALMVGGCERPLTLTTTQLLCWRHIRISLIKAGYVPRLLTARAWERELDAALKRNEHTSRAVSGAP